MFTFTNVPTREEDRRIVQDILIPFVSANRAGPSTLPTAPNPIKSPTGKQPGSPNGVVTNPVKGKRKAEDGIPEIAISGGSNKAGKPGMNKLRLRVLNKNPNLKLLHRELVLAKQITEEEFWEGREVGFYPVIKITSGYWEEDL